MKQSPDLLLRSGISLYRTRLHAEEHHHYAPCYDSVDDPEVTARQSLANIPYGRQPFAVYVPHEQYFEWQTFLREHPDSITVTYRSRSSQCFHYFGHCATEYCSIE